MSRGLRLSALSMIPIFVAALLTAGDQPPSLRNHPAPPISLPIIANGSGTFVLGKERGHGVYINFFASWCEPCQEEARTLEMVTSESAWRNVRVVGIAVLDEPGNAARFANAHGWRYPIVVDKSGYVGAAYRLSELPLHVFIGADGVIRQYVEGGPIPASELRTGLAEISGAP